MLLSSVASAQIESGVDSTNLEIDSLLEVEILEALFPPVPVKNIEPDTVKQIRHYKNCLGCGRG